LKAFHLKLAGVILVMAIAVIFVLPTFVMYSKGQNEPLIWPHKKINLGLDLQGGVHLVLEVEIQKAIENLLDSKIYDLKKDLIQKQIVPRNIARQNGQNAILVSLESSDQSSSLEEILKKEFPELEIKNRNTDSGNYNFSIGLLNKEEERIKRNAVDQSLETIRNRIDQFGVSEPVIMKQGDNRILVELPGIKDTKRAKELIGKTAVLQFRLVDEEHDVQRALDSAPPPDSEILYEVKKDPLSGETISSTPLLIKKDVLLTGESLTDARLSIDSTNSEYFVSIDFDGKGAKKFASITEQNIKKRLAIVLDNTVYSAPVIQSKIPGGHARITGNFTQEDGKILSVALRSGALPAPVAFLEERTVGPSLGLDSIHKGLRSMLIGSLAVFLFMVLYYKGSGLIADIALLLNVLLMAAGLSILGATLTLPGIAGFILTIGMAVDSSVLIFERMREELRLGQSPAAAVAAGFEKATLTILDSNVTTMVSSIVLYQFGTGPVKGFAVTLILGILGSLFTSLIVSRLLFDVMISKLNVKTLSI
jgi:preprotein translocase subunit SecD